MSLLDKKYLLRWGDTIGDDPENVGEVNHCTKLDSENYTISITINERDGLSAHAYVYTDEGKEHLVMDGSLILQDSTVDEIWQDCDRALHKWLGEKLQDWRGLEAGYHVSQFPS
tara:strand:+ start:1573 stop:1914 length:342 start_codon:yes stop_codon:yes gene_type:complete